MDKVKAAFIPEPDPDKAAAEPAGNLGPDATAVDKVKAAFIPHYDPEEEKRANAPAPVEEDLRQHFTAKKHVGPFGGLHSDDQMGPFHNDGDTEHTAKEKYFGMKEAHLHDGERRTSTPGNMFHGEHAVPPASVAETTAAHQPAHHTFVREGYNHQHHIGVDGKIGVENEVSGVGGSDARRSSNINDIPASTDEKFIPAPVEPTIAEKQANAPQGTIIEPRTGLPMNVEKYGTGHGGVDGSDTIMGYDSTSNAERAAHVDATYDAERHGSVTWEGVKDNE